MFLVVTSLAEILPTIARVLRRRPPTYSILTSANSTSRGKALSSSSPNPVIWSTNYL